MHDFDWFLDRLEVAQWKDETPGRRDVMTNCPGHGGSDSLHIEEKNGKAVLYCFADCGRDAYRKVVAALEDGPDDTRDLEDEAPETQPVAPTVRVTRRRRTSPEVTADGEQPQTPLDWAAARCGMTREELDSLDLPLAEVGSQLVFTFAGTDTQKVRKIGEARKKDIFWTGAAHPPLWPSPVNPPEEIIITEGEFDAIALTLAYGEALGVYSITGGSSDVPDVSVFERLRDLGVVTVRVVFDADAAGRKGTEAVVEAIRAAGLQARIYQVAGIDALRDEKDARDVALRIGAAHLQLEDAVDEDDAQPLSGITVVPPAKLLCGYIHPEEHTVLYGDGGTGKGVVAAWWVAELLKPGLGEDSDRPAMRVLIVDYEAHAQYEWRPRIGKFLGPSPTQQALLHNVSIVQPQKPIWDIQDWLAEQITRTESDLVVIDSVTYAVVGMPAEDSTTAIKYSMAINRLGVPVLSLAHVTKADANPRHPFGSAYWSNGARVTVAISRTSPADPAAPRLLKNWKSNQRHEVPDMEVDWSWLEQDLPDKLTFTRVTKTVKARVADAYAALSGELGREPSPEEVGQYIEANYGEVVKPNTVRGTLKRARDAGEVAKVSFRSKADA